MLADDLLPGAKAAAEFIGITRKTLYHLVEDGEVKAIRKGRRLYFRRSDLVRTFSLENADLSTIESSQ